MRINSHNIPAPPEGIVIDMKKSGPNETENSPRKRDQIMSNMANEGTAS